MKQEFSVVRIKKSTLDCIREIADANNSTPPKIIDGMLGLYLTHFPLGQKFETGSMTVTSTSGAGIGEWIFVKASDGQ